MSRLVRGVGDGVLWVTAILGAVAVAATAALWLSSSHLVVVTSGSMEPSIPVGSVVVATPVPVEMVSNGDVLQLNLPSGERVLHRVVDRETQADGSVIVRTKGDANAKADPHPTVLGSEREVWRAGRVVPGLGTAATLMRSPLAGFAAAAAMLGPLALRGRRNGGDAGRREPALA